MDRSATTSTPCVSSAASSPESRRPVPPGLRHAQAAPSPSQKRRRMRDGRERTDADDCRSVTEVGHGEARSFRLHLSRGRRDRRAPDRVRGPLRLRPSLWRAPPWSAFSTTRPTRKRAVSGSPAYGAICAPALVTIVENRDENCEEISCHIHCPRQLPDPGMWRGSS